MKFKEFFTNLFANWTVKKTVFTVMCVLLLVVIILFCVVIGKITSIFKTEKPDGTTDPSTSETTLPPETTQPSTSETTLPPETTEPTIVTEPGHVHEFVLSESVAATCENYGYNIYICSCGKQDIPLDEQVEPYGHSYGAGQVVAATCTEDGCTQYVCSRCGDIDERNVVKATGHDHQMVEAVEATCGSEGYTLYRCANCGEEEKRDVVPALEHAYEVVEEHGVTCTDDGYTLYQCINCGETYESDVVHAQGHAFGEWYQLADSSWKRDCANCATKETSADLSITSDQVSGDYVHDENGQRYKLYMIYVGTKNSPDLFHYTISDYLDNGTLSYHYDAVQGLVISYTTNAGESATVVLPVFQSVSAIIPSDPVPTEPLPTETTE